MDEGSLCTACNRGSLVRNRVRRANGFLVFLGFLFMIGAFFGVLLGTAGALMTGFISTQAKRAPDEIRAELKELKVPDVTIDHALSFEATTAEECFKNYGQLTEEMNGLSPEQQSAVTRAWVAGFGRRVPIGEFLTASLIFLAVSIAVGVVGFLFIRKKWVLQCTECPAVVPVP
jgi:ABC-type antimicrobial peptide transport system permease subunit